MGPLKEEYMSTMGRNHRRTYSENIGLSATSGQLVAERPDVLPGPSGDIPDGQDRLGNGVTVRRKDSVARMTLDGLSYVVTVSFCVLGFLGGNRLRSECVFGVRHTGFYTK